MDIYAAAHYDIDTILRIVPIPSLHHLCQAIDLDAVPATVLPPLEELPLADQRSHHDRCSLGRWHYPNRLLPLRTDGKELAPTSRGHLHSDHSLLLRSANPEHHHRSSDHRGSHSRSHAPSTQQEVEDWSDHDVRLGNHHACLRHRSPGGST